MMLSSIVYGFGSYKAYDNKAYKAYDNKAYNSLNPFGSHMRESLVCTSPFLPLNSVYLGVWCLRLCWICSYLLELSTHPLCVFTTERECNCKSSGGTIVAG
jgi:hypothetical protein